MITNYFAFCNILLCSTRKPLAQHVGVRLKTKEDEFFARVSKIIIIGLTSLVKFSWLLWVSQIITRNIYWCSQGDKLISYKN